MKKNEEQIRQLKHECNKGKDELMKIWNKLEGIGATKEFEQLGKIIEKLELWQNK